MGTAHDLRRHELQGAAHGDGDAVGVEAEFLGQAEVDDFESVDGMDAWTGRTEHGAGGPAALAQSLAFVDAGTAVERRHEHDVLRLHVQVEDPLGMDEFDAFDDLSEKVSAFGFGESVILGGDPLEEFAAFEVFSQNDALFFAFEVILLEYDYSN